MIPYVATAPLAPLLLLALAGVAESLGPVPFLLIPAVAGLVQAYGLHLALRGRRLDPEGTGAPAD